MKKKKLIVAIKVLAIVIALIGGILAYFTHTTNTLTNTFTVGENVTITLTEPNFDPLKAQGLSFGKTVDKDPTVTNTGSNDAYVFVKVEVPTYYKYTGEGNQSDFPMFTYTLNNGWYELTSLQDTNFMRDEIHIYAYGSASGMTALEPSDTATLFDDVTFLNNFPYSSKYEIIEANQGGFIQTDDPVISGEGEGSGSEPTENVNDPARIPDSSDIRVTAYAIQTNGLTVDNTSNPGHDKTAVTPEEVYLCLYADVPPEGGLVNPNSDPEPEP